MLWVYLCQFERLPTWKLQKTTNHFRTIWFCCVELRRLPNILVVCCFCKLVKLWPLLGLFRLQSSLFRSGRNRRFWRSSHALRGHFWPLNHTKKRKKFKRSLKKKRRKKKIFTYMFDFVVSQKNHSWSYLLATFNQKSKIRIFLSFLVVFIKILIQILNHTFIGAKFQ